MAKSYWLMKSEPDVYSISDLKRDKKTIWDGVRNYQARNFMMKEMKKGDLVLFYHSNSKPSGVAGVAEIVDVAVADPTQFDPNSPYYDPKSTKKEPRWKCAKIQHKKSFSKLVGLPEIKTDKKLAKMVLLHNSRLSVQPVTATEFQHILTLGKS